MRETTRISGTAIVALSALFPSLWTTPLAAQRERPHVLGSASCGNATCHGNLPERGPIWRSSQTIWETEDPHAKAGLVLLEPASQRIVKALDPSATTEEQRLRILQSRCFGCHTTLSAADIETPPALATSAGLPLDILAEGVSCESCHGPASIWVKQHVMFKFTPKLGMRNTKDWLPRIEVCVQCHVGSRSADGVIRDVNHDLIAAGHPALRFDPLLYNVNLPKHWQPDRPLHAQTALHESGRWKALAAAAALTRDRIDARDSSVPWPEFADYDCFGCHHELRGDSNRRRARRAGKPDWNPWYTAELSSHLSGRMSGRRQFSLSAASRAENLATLRANVEKLAQSANEQAEQAMEQRPTTPVQSLRVALERGQNANDWHDAAAWYLSVRAALADCKASQALPQEIAGDMEARVGSLVNTTLRFSTPDSALQSPRYFSADAFGQARNELMSLLLQAKLE